MSDRVFHLRFSKDDLLDLYRQDLNYKLFSAENYYRLAMGALFIALAIASAVGIQYNKEYYFLVLVCIFGAGYQAVELGRSYWDKRVKNRGTLEWVEAVGKYKDHSLVMSENSFTYHRDNEIYVYEARKVKRKYHTDTHFYFSDRDDNNLLVPAKAFAAGEYQEFIALVDAMPIT